MATVLHRITKQLIYSVHTPDYSPADWIINPDLSAVQSQPQKYWQISGDSVSLLSEKEQAIADDSVVRHEINTTSLPVDNFGNGADGAIVIDSDRTLDQDIYPTKLVVNEGVTLRTSGFRILAKDGIDISGTIECDGGDAKGQAGGPGGAVAVLGGGGSGADGAPGKGVDAESFIDPSNAALGGNGGDGSKGGKGGICVDLESLKVRPNRFNVVLDMAGFDSNGRFVFKGGAGGGSGVDGGGGGGGGGLIVLAAPFILIGATGVVSAKGGAGDDSGGGGGGGGVIALVYKRFRNSGKIVVTGGAGGKSGGTNGNDGRIINFNVDA